MNERGDGGVTDLRWWMTCEQKGTVAVVSLMGNVQTRRDGCGATGGWVTCKRERGWQGHGWTMCE